jgi:hypothetical protein
LYIPSNSKGRAPLLIDNVEESDTLKVKDEPKSSKAILEAIENSQHYLRDWQAQCDTIDDIYSRKGLDDNLFPILGTWSDAELDLFWASMEIVKPAIYAHAPKPVVSPMFKDNTLLKTKTADLLERVSVSAFERSGIDEVMCDIRDDLIFTNRGVMWITYESEDGQKVCFEHLDRKDFAYEPARKWVEVGWVARRAWMTREEMRKRFAKFSGEAYMDASMTTGRDNDRDRNYIAKKASVWEVWHRADNKVYWVAEGCDVMLDSDEPHLELSGFFPCPRPAFGTLERRTLKPVPDYLRYAAHFGKINTLTSRIYLLLDSVKLKGIIAGSGDVRSAVEQLMEADDDQILISVPTISTDMQQAIVWIPLKEVTEAITGLIMARTQLIDDYYQLSGISDIMRGATEAEETLGAQQLKSQYGSVRIRQKIQELQRIARDADRIAAEIIAEKFSKETLLEMAQMEIPSKADIEKQIKGIEKAAEQELKALVTKAEEMAQQMPDEQRQQASQEFQQAQQQIVSKYAGMLNEANNQVPVEDVITLLRDDRARCFAFEIEDGSTIWPDEQAEKAARNEYMGAFSGAATGLMPLTQTGPAGVDLAGAMFKFQLAPYRAGRELDSLIDAWVDSMKANPMPAEGGEGADMAAATAKLAEAEMQKAQAQMEKVKADSQLKQAELMGKMQEMQQKAQKDQMDAQIKVGGLELQMKQQEQDFAAKMAETEAKINKMQAETAAILSSIGLDVRKQDLEEYREARASEQQQVDTALKVNAESRSDRQQAVGEQQQDRQMSLSERQAMEANNA